MMTFIRCVCRMAHMFSVSFREWFSSIQQTLKSEEVFVLLCLVAMGQIHVLLKQDTESGTASRP